MHLLFDQTTTNVTLSHVRKQIDFANTVQTPHVLDLGVHVDSVARIDFTQGR
jgi:hypothetical protein